MTLDRRMLRTNFQNAKVLVVDDNPDYQTIIATLLHQVLPEIEPIQVTTSAAALTHLETCSGQEWEMPKLILLDLYLPNREDGWQTLQRIRSLPDPFNSIPVVMFSNSNQPEDIQEAYCKGSSCYLIKPRELDQWLHCFQHLRKYWWETVVLPRVRFSF